MTYLRAPWIIFDNIADSSFSAKVHFQVFSVLKNIFSSSRNFVLKIESCELRGESVREKRNFGVRASFEYPTKLRPPPRTKTPENEYLGMELSYRKNPKENFCLGLKKSSFKVDDVKLETQMARR